MIHCFVGLGSNLGDSLTTLRRAADELEALEKTRPAGRSAIYSSAPVGPGDQEAYLNAVLGLLTQLAPLDLLDALQTIENSAGRIRGERWGPRTLDLDLLLYGGEEIAGERLTVPHPAMFERNFVLRPLHDLAGDDWEFPDGSGLRERLAACPPNPLERTDLDWLPHAARTVSA